MPSAFVDTNVLIYAADQNINPSRHTRIAREILLLEHISISVQVVNEFIANSRNPKNSPSIQPTSVPGSRSFPTPHRIADSRHGISRPSFASASFPLSLGFASRSIRIGDGMRRALQRRSRSWRGLRWSKGHQPVPRGIGKPMPPPEAIPLSALQHQTS
jgi:Predicted nucleic-acid-binding protein, contains PIN domain